MQNKFDIIKAGISTNDPHIVCITETWIPSNSCNDLYQLDNYDAFFSHRCNMRRGGTGIYVKTNLRAKMVSEEITDNNAYVICAVTTGKSPNATIIVTVYRAPGPRMLTLKQCAAK